MLLEVIFVSTVTLCLAEKTENPSEMRPYPFVTVQQGDMRGTYLKTRNGREINAFLGIPFAKPPIKDLRFEPPVPVDPWIGVKNATKIHDLCPQRDIYRRTSLIEGTEDCLYLNVYSPKLVNVSYPVMVFLHGGGWLAGSGNTQWYGPSLLLDRDVVLVVTNYRLGALGFLSTGDEFAPGNNGLKDQALALRWVKDNIAQFGGNPDKITLFGESAGGASVQLHMVSPLSRGLFHGGISQSGSAQCSWALSPNDQTARHSRHLAKLFNCPTSTSQKMVDCLRTIDAHDIIAQDRVFMKWDTDPMIPFKPVIEPDVEGAFLTEHPLDAMKAGRVAKIPWMAGLNSEDGALRAAAIVSNATLLEEFDKDFSKIIPMSLFFEEISSNNPYMAHKIRKYYFGDEKLNENMKADLVNLYTDGWFLNGIEESVRIHKKYVKSPVYYYLFAHRGVASFSSIFGDPVGDYGVCHADELQYLFPVGEGLWPDLPPTEDDLKMAEIMTSLWVNFATTGNPTSKLDDLITKPWYPVQSDAMEYYNIHLESENGPEMSEKLYHDRAAFWRRLPAFVQQNEIKDEL